MIPEPIIILLLAFSIDLIVGEPPNFVHLTVWIGKFVEVMESLLRRVTKRDKVSGILLALTSLGFFISIVIILIKLVAEIWFLRLLVSSLILKMTFAFNSMFKHIIPIMRNLNSDLEQSRRHLSKVVRRDTSKLNEPLVASGAIETIAEGFVDGFLSPIFFYSIFGLPGAVAYRVINTLDSMVGYKDDRYLNFGWFSAKLDTIANFIPARLSSLIFVFSALILGKDWRRGINTIKENHSSTESKNAGWPMSAMSGTLGVRLEKVGAYVLGGRFDPPSSKKILEALKIFSVSGIITFLISSFLIEAFLEIRQLLTEAFNLVS